MLLVSSLGVYATLFSMMGRGATLMSFSTVKTLNLIHIATLYLAIVAYFVSYVRRLRFSVLVSMVLLLVSSYSGVMAEVWRFQCVSALFIPPFIFELRCSSECHALCNHFTAFEVSIPLITTFVVLVWASINILRTRRPFYSS